MKNKLKVFENIGELVTLDGADTKGGRRVRETDLSIHNNAVLVCNDGRVAWTGTKANFTPRILEPFGKDKAVEVINLGGQSVIPGLVECHTHMVFAGDRSEGTSP